MFIHNKTSDIQAPEVLRHLDFAAVDMGLFRYRSVIYIFNQISRLAFHYAAKFSERISCYGFIMSDSLQSLSINAFIGQTIE